MSDSEKKQLAKAMIPLEVLSQQIQDNPYREMTQDFQDELVDSVATLRNYILAQK